MRKVETCTYRITKRLLEDHVNLLERLAHDVEVQPGRTGDLVTHEQLDLVLLDPAGARWIGLAVLVDDTTAAQRRALNIKSLLVRRQLGG